ncbi:MAG TPA: tRNA (adenosine(37)-N6)-threonylcarbamoyltransferase complex transferase subunit TsaD [Candidatus Paceibacterota bacterium]
MRILAIETSCDETAISILEFDKTPGVLSTEGRVLSHIVSSQVALHAPYGGVVPNIAKRAHQNNLVPILKQALQESGLLSPQTQHTNILKFVGMLSTILEREAALLEQAKEFLPTIANPEIDAVAVTYGPGLEPALWVGLNFAKALAMVWQKPLIPVSHMEGHIFSSLLRREISNDQFLISNVEFPAVALLISGGHTELIKMDGLLSYELLGQTRDDAVGEAFDKVARLLGLPYPGGPQISALAEKFQGSTENSQGQALGNSKGLAFKLPRPMIKSDDLDFSFSGIKTAVRYMIDKLPKPVSEKQTIEISHEFEVAVTDVIVAKTKKALNQTGAQSLLVGGGVIANKRIRESLQLLTSELEVKLYLPEPWLTGDNASMIAIAAYFSAKGGPASGGRMMLPGSQKLHDIRARGTLRLHSS